MSTSGASIADAFRRNSEGPAQNQGMGESIFLPACDSGLRSCSPLQAGSATKKRDSAASKFEVFIEGRFRRSSWGSKAAATTVKRFGMMSKFDSVKVVGTRF